MSTTPSIAVSLLLLSLLLSQAQGIRLEKGFISVTQQNKNIREDSAVLTKRSDAPNSGVLGKDCGHDDHHCSSSAISSSEKSSSSHSHHWLPSIHEDYYGPRTLGDTDPSTIS